MGVTKKQPKVQAAQEATNFDDFLETLDNSDESESDNENDSDLEEEEEDSDEDVENGHGTTVNGNHHEQDDSGSEVEDEEKEDDNENDEDEIAEDSNEKDIEVNEEPSQSNREVNTSKTEDMDDEGNNFSSDSEDEEDMEKQAAEHKKALQKLQETDPDFFAYLKENDADLLNFDDSGDDSETDEDAEGPLHKPPEELEEASDSEAEEERIDAKVVEKGKVEKLMAKGIVNLEVIKNWETILSTSRDLATFVNVIEAFDCAVHQILEGEDSQQLKWKVDGSANFNALVRLCIKNVKSFCVRYLCGSNNLTVSEQKFDQRPMEFKDKCSQKWSKLRSKLKSYMSTLVKFIKSMGNSDAVASILRHCQKMSGFWALLATKSFKLLRTLINIWSSGEDSCRIVAFLTIIRMTNYNREVFLLRIYKQMYLAYVSNCKFTSVNTWPTLNLMRSCLTEVYLLDPSLSYTVAFPFIRQLAIHLRNALTAGTTAQAQSKQNKKEASRIVYSWQFVHSLNLWADLLAHSSSSQDENLKLLIYPVVQICLGTIKLIPTKKYIPLRFLIIRMLIKLQEKTGVFIPILPLITEVLLMTEFSLKSISKFSVRPLDMTCCLKADASESGYSKAISENVFELILRTCKSIATDLAFPEIVTPTLMQLRSFLKKKCKNPEVCRKFKTLIEKIDSNSKYISGRRSKSLEAGTVSLSDIESQKILGVQMETTKPHPPLLEFATDYLKANAKIQAKIRKVNVETREEKLIPKPTGPHSQKKKPTKNFNPNQQLLDSDDDDSETGFKTKFDSEPEKEAEAVASKPAKKKKAKRKLEDNSVSGKQKNKKKAKKQKLESQFEAQDELVDLELSD